MQVNNRPELKEIRRALRNHLMPSEATLWKALQRSQLAGRKFRRQHSVGNYVLDFYCPPEKLAVELAGAPHFTAAGYEYDTARTAYLAEKGIRVIRFENELVFISLEGVLARICEMFDE